MFDIQLPTGEIFNPVNLINSSNIQDKSLAHAFVNKLTVLFLAYEVSTEEVTLKDLIALERKIIERKSDTLKTISHLNNIIQKCNYDKQVDHAEASREAEYQLFAKVNDEMKTFSKLSFLLLYQCPVYFDVCWPSEYYISQYYGKDYFYSPIDYDMKIADRAGQKMFTNHYTEYTLDSILQAKIAPPKNADFISHVEDAGEFLIEPSSYLSWLELPELIKELEDKFKGQNIYLERTRPPINRALSKARRDAAFTTVVTYGQTFFSSYEVKLSLDDAPLSSCAP